jgi:hypothetical protein
MRECENSTPRVAVGVRLRNNPPVITLHTSLTDSLCDSIAVLDEHSA